MLNFVIVAWLFLFINIMKRILHFIPFFLIFISLPLSAEQSLKIAYEFSDYLYQEPDGDYSMKLKGNMQGINVRYENYFKESLYYFALDGRFMGGSTDYYGRLMATPPIPYKSENINNYYYDWQLCFGSVIDLSYWFKAWLSFGFAYRYLKNQLDKDPHGYLRESNYIYMPFATEFCFVSGIWGFSFKGEIDYLLYGWQYSHMPKGTVRNKQHSGYGLRISAKIKLNLDRKKTYIFVEPFYRFWNIQDSDINGGYLEPHNTTKESGICMGIIF